MKKIKITVVKVMLMAVLLVTASCEETLDLQPISEIGVDDFYSTPEELNLAVIAIYSSLQDMQDVEWMMTELRSDNTYMNPLSSEAKDLPLRELDRHVAQSQNINIQEYWKACYRTINLANVVMQNLDVVTDETQRNTYEGEARFLRSHAYFNLVRLWGGVFLVDHPVSGSEAKELDRSPQNEVYDFIVEDFTVATQLLPEVQAGNNLGRVTADAAKILLSKTLLTRKATGDIAQAKIVLAEVVNGTHSLLDDYASVFDIGNEYNNEVIFAVRYQSGGVGLGSPFPNFFAPLQSENYVVFGNGDGRNVPTESISDAYTSADTRKAPSMADEWIGFQGIVNPDRYIAKYNSQFSNVDDSGNDWIITRYADALLLLAEAINEDSGPDTEALGYLNQVRTRALGDAAALTIGEVNTYFDFKIALEEERRLEFAFENHRWFDLLRTGRVLTVMSEHFANEFQYNDPDHPAFNTPPIDHYQIFLPIPQYEIDINPNIAQMQAIKKITMIFNRTIYITALLLSGWLGATAAEIKVGTPTELNAAIATVKPGDKIIMSNGNWKDISIAFTANGTKTDSIFLMAETPGKVALTGKSSLEIGGDYLVVNGLWFKEGASPKKYVVSFSSNKTVATNSRLTNCAITSYNPQSKSDATHWVELWGKHNRVDHCTLYGKTNEGTTLVVWLKGDENRSNYHRIDHNYFGERPPLGSNGGETIRIGTSTNSMYPSHTLVELNKFEKCNGEVEIISSKSCNNIFRYNLFVESQGSLVTRHGNSCLIENNVFLGNGQPYTGGVRVINEGHTVKNNYFSGLTGTDFRSSIAVMNGILNGPLNRYNQVKNATISSNIFYKCSPFLLGAGSDSERTLPPVDSAIKDNIIYSENKELVIFNDDMKGIAFEGNLADAPNAEKPKGFVSKKLDWAKEGELYIPKGQKMNYALFAPALEAKRGVNWNAGTYKTESSTAAAVNTIIVEPGKGTLEEALKKAKGAAILSLSPGNYELERALVIRGDITIDGGTGEKPVIFFTASPEKAYNYMIKVDADAKLILNNIKISGKENADAKYAINSPSTDTPGNYSLYINNCEVTDFNNPEGGAVFKANKGTFADTIKVSNSVFKNCLRGFNLSYEKDDKGKYNAENIIFKNSVFINFGQWVLHYYRGGNDESTLGGNLHVNHCVFSKIGSRDKDWVLLNKGIVTVNIENSVFYDNPNIQYAARLDGKTNSIHNSVVYNSGEVKTTSKAVSENVIGKNPDFDNREKFIPGKKSPLLNAGTDGKNIGLVH